MGLTGLLDVICCGDEVPLGKPDPALYRLALTRLGLHARQAIGVEDSEAGVRSCCAAGLFTILIPEADPGGEVLDCADLCLPSLFALRDAIGTLPG